VVSDVIGAGLKISLLQNNFLSAKRILQHGSSSFKLVIQKTLKKSLSLQTYIALI